MTTAARHPLVEDYLKRLWVEAARLPVDQARELVADIEEHLAAAVSPDASETDVRNALERLGTPGELVTAASGAPEQPPGPTTKSFASPVGAVVCLVVAEFFCFLLPLSLPLWILGLVMLFRATVWSDRATWLAALSLGTGLPGGLVLVGVSLFAVTSCSESYENGRLVSSTCGGTNWSAIIAITLTVAYFALQGLTIWWLFTKARVPAAQR